MQPVSASLFFLGHYFDRSEFVSVQGSKNIPREFREVVVRESGRLKMKSPDLEYWCSEDDGGFIRGDICFYSESNPLSVELMERYENRVIWNYSTIVNGVVEAWSKNHVLSEKTSYLIQHTNRIAGSDYLLIKATLPGIIEMHRVLGKSYEEEWVYDKKEVDLALIEAKNQWQRKWFMSDSILEKSLKAISYLFTAQTKK